MQPGITPRFLAWVDILILRSVFGSETSMLKTAGTTSGIKEVETRCYDDHCKDGARDILETKWKQWMSGPLYDPQQEGKQGRRRTADGHPLLQKVELPPAPDGDGEGAASASTFKWDD